MHSIMKRLLFAVLAAALLISCEKENVIHTGDITGSLYGIWQLDTKTVVYNSGNNEKSDVKDYSNAHFYLSLSEPRLALAKKGSFTNLDLDDVDVDATTFSFNADQRSLSFDDILWLSDEFFSYNMILKGKFDVLELTETKLVISQKDLTEKTTTVYSYHRYR